MGKAVAKRGTIEAITVYCKDELVARDCTVTLPEAVYQTADIKAMGTISLPLLSCLDDMETTITKEGIDKNLTKLTSPGAKNIEYRWVHDVIHTNGKVDQEGCKAFLRVMPKTLIPGASLETGSVTENDVAFAVTRYRLVVNGEELLLIDRFASIIKVNGVDVSSNFDKYL
ncbi:MAG: phage major tail tube protein [Lachnospiraceae bacterium]|nr:phage major tail tube protein [Lachnospiraceae bacterium]